MEKKEVSYIFGKTLTKHLQDMPTNQRYLELRIERFSEEFLNSDTTMDNIDDMLVAIYDYMNTIDEEYTELEHTLINLNQSIFWLREYSEL